MIGTDPLTLILDGRADAVTVTGGVTDAERLGDTGALPAATGSTDRAGTTGPDDPADAVVPAALAPAVFTTAIATPASRTTEARTPTPRETVRIGAAAWRPRARVGGSAEPRSGAGTGVVPTVRPHRGRPRQRGPGGSSRAAGRLLGRPGLDARRMDMYRRLGYFPTETSEHSS